MGKPPPLTDTELLDWWIAHGICWGVSQTRDKHFEINGWSAYSIDPRDPFVSGIYPTGRAALAAAVAACKAQKRKTAS